MAITLGALPPRHPRHPEIRDDWMIDDGHSPAEWSLVYTRLPGNSEPLRNNYLRFWAEKVTSNDGEEGILAQVFRVIGTTNRWLCEFGARDGEYESNTLAFVRDRGWHAVYIEPDAAQFAKLDALYRDRSDVICLNSFVELHAPKRIDDLLARTPCPRDLDLMVIDIDGNDYHVLATMEACRPRVLMIEFNATIQPEVSFAQPPDMAIGQGSSLQAIATLARSKGYELVATTMWNAIFVRSEFASNFRIEDNSPAAMHRGPTQFSLFQLYDGTLVLGSWALMHWSPVRIALEDIQVLPKHLRRFSRGLEPFTTFFDISGNTFECDWRAPFEPTQTNPLAAHRLDVASYFGDDGILSQIFSRLDRRSRVFLDFGSFGRKRGSRTWALSGEPNWTGFVIRHPEQDAGSVGAEWRHSEYPMSSAYIDLPDFHAMCPDDILTMVRARVDAVDLLSLGIYGADYQAWQLLNELQPRIVAIQFNPTIPNGVHFVQKSDFRVHQGCSLNALMTLGATLGYRLIACSLGTAFFCRLEEADQFQPVEPEIDDIYRSPLRMHLFQLFDASFRLAGLDLLLWRGIQLGADEIQVMPRALRRSFAHVLPRTPHSIEYYLG
jgi:hypothetical protein